MRRAAILLTAISSLPLAILAGRSIAITVEQFFDPCMEWNLSTGSGSLHSSTPKIAGNDPCASRRAATSETKTGAIIRLLLVGGGIIAAILLGIRGTVRSRQGLAVTGAVMMFLEAIPLMFSFAALPVLASGSFLLSARATSPFRGTPKIAARVLGVIAGLAGLSGIVGALRYWATAAEPAPLLLWLLSVCCFFVTAVAWWPSADLTSPV
jgi:hypothetical protein